MSDDAGQSNEDGFRHKMKGRVTALLPKIRQNPHQSDFFTALYTRNIPKILKFLELGADVNLRNGEYGVHPIHILAERNDSVLAYRIMQMTNLKLSSRTMQGDTALHLASKFNKKKFVNFLIQEGADVNERDKFDRTALHLAIEMQNYEIVKILLKNGAIVNVLDCFLNTPLSVSICGVKNMKIAKTLFGYGVNFSMECRRTLHIFFEAILCCHTIDEIDFVSLLLDEGVNINMREEATGRMCLHFAAITGFLELGIFLVNNGANLSATDLLDRTPARTAQEHENFILADYFRKGYRPTNLLITWKMVHEWTDKVRARIAERKAREEMEAAKEAELKAKRRGSILRRRSVP